MEEHPAESMEVQEDRTTSNQEGNSAPSPTPNRQLQRHRGKPMELLLEQRDKDMPSLATDSESEEGEDAEDNVLLSHSSETPSGSERPPMSPPATPQLEVVEEDQDEEDVQVVASASSVNHSNKSTRHDERRNRQVDEPHEVMKSKKDRKEAVNLELKTTTLVVLDSTTLAKIIHGSLPLENRISNHQIWRLEKHRWTDYHEAFGVYGPYTPQPPRCLSLWALGNYQLLMGNQKPVRDYRSRMFSPSSPGAGGTTTWGIGNLVDPLTFQGRALSLVSLSGRSKDERSGILLDTPVKVPAEYRLMAPYLKYTYTTDQDTNCKLHHVEDTVCVLCRRRVLCYRNNCPVCEQALQLTMDEILGDPRTREEAEARWSPREVKDVLYHELVTNGELPAAANSRFPVHRLTDQEEYRDIWGQRSFEKAKAPSSIGGNPTYNAMRRCKQCLKVHTYVCRKMTAAFYLPNEMKYDDIMHSRDPGRLVPRMMADFKEDEWGPYRLEPFNTCPKVGVTWNKALADAGAVQPGSLIGKFIDLIKKSTSTVL